MNSPRWHADITKLGNQTFTYDSSDRHATTVVTDPAGLTTVSYLRDVSGAVVARTETAPGVAPVTYRYSGPFVLADTGTGFHITQRTLTLTGGVVVSLPVSGAPVWSYPNIHGDITWTADAAGARTGFFQYDPFGQPIDPVTKVIGSAVADESIPDTMPGSFDPGWVGSKGKGYEHAGSIAIIEMGVRMYSPWLGRFLAADPVAGGNTSWYNYPNDPINMFDLTGESSCSIRVAERGGCPGSNSTGHPSPSAADARDSARGGAQGSSAGSSSGASAPKLAGYKVTYHGTLSGSGWDWKMKVTGPVLLVAKYGGSGIVDVNVSREMSGKEDRVKCILVSGQFCTLEFMPRPIGGNLIEGQYTQHFTAMVSANSWCEECGWPSSTGIGLQVYSLSPIGGNG